ncbi:MAG TPA: enoyl-CoA hydratase-related protein, partial [Gemmata sp.]|nr:enoyl-CoA hydratase-related protein [Gemmata sp.]
MSDLQPSIRSDSVAVLTLDQQGSKANVLTLGLWAELEAVLDSLAGRTELRGLILASAKPDIFIAGADLKLLVNATGSNDPAVRTFIEQGLRVLSKLENLPFPTVAAIDGVALGGGLEVALACDVRMAGPNPKLRLGLPEVTLGLIPGWGGTQRLPRIIGMPNAVAMVVSGQPIDSSQAAQYQLIEGCVAVAKELVDAAASYLLATPREPVIRKKKQEPVASWIPEGDVSVKPNPDDSVAVHEAKRILSEGASRPFPEGIKLETETFLRLAGSEES